MATGEPLDEEVFDRFAARLSYVARRLRATRRPTSASPTRSRAPQRPVFYLEIPPFLFGTVVEGARRRRPDRERARRRREAVRPRPRVGPGARRRAAPVPRRVAALPDRPLPREDGPRGDPLPALRQHDARAGLEPQLRRLRPDHDGRGLRRRGPRPLLRPGRRAARRRRQPPHAGRRGRGDGAAGRRATRTRSRTRSSRSSARCRDGRPGALRARPVRRLPRRSTASPPTRRPRRSPRCGSRSTTGAGRACRSSSAPASACRSRRPSCGSSSSTRRGSASACTAGAPGAEPARRQARPVDRRPAAARRAPRRAPTEPEPINLDMEFADEGGEGADAVRGAAARRDASATARASRARTASRRRGGSCSRCSTRRRPCTPTRTGSWGPAAADDLRRRPRPLARARGSWTRTGDERLRRHHHRHAARAAARSPATSPRRASGSCCSSAATGCRASRRTGTPHDVFVDNRYVSPDTWYDEQRQGVPAAGPLLRRRRDEALRRRAVPAARARTSASCATTTASRRPGRSPTTRWSRTTRRPSSSTRCTARAARTRPSRRRARPYPFPAVSHEPRIQQLSDDLEAAGLPPVPRAVRRHARRGEHAVQRAACAARTATASRASCTRKSDAEVLGVRPALEHPNVTLLTNAEAVRLETNAGRHGRHRGRRRARRRRARRYARRHRRRLAAAPRTRAKLLLASANDTHPNGLANGSDQVGRNYMFHNSQAVLALSQGGEPDGLPEDARAQRLLLRRDGLRLPARATSRWSASRRPRCTAARSRCETKLAPEWTLERRRPARGRLLALDGGPAARRRTASRCDRDGSVTLAYTPTNDVPKERLYAQLKSMLGHARHAPRPPASRATRT